MKQFCLKISIFLLINVTLFVSQSKADFLVSQNLGASAYTASRQAQSFVSENAFDGDLTTLWNSGDFAVEWIEVDLQQAWSLTRFDFRVAQTPNSNTTHEIWASDTSMMNDLSSATLIHTLDGFTTNGQTLSFTLPNQFSAQHVQIRTTASASWVAWFEVQVYASSIPEPSALWPVMLGCLLSCFWVRVR